MADQGKALAELWRGLDTGSAYTTWIDFQDDGAGEIFIKPVKSDWFVQFSLQFGELLYQLRAALDSCVYDAALIHKGKLTAKEEKAVMFPICTDDPEFRNSERRIEPLPDKLRAYIESIQPYKKVVITNNVGTYPLSQILDILNRWSVIDRHRRLHIVGTIPMSGRIELSPPNGMTVDELIFESGGILEDQSKIGTCKIGNFFRGPKIGVKTQLAFEIGVKDGDVIAIASNSIPATLVVVWEIMEQFKKFFGIA
ncbi:hypothetical protein [Alloacidobacterium sp.]|uniref:hypothetical protein n=1 Tax=Alloacidobacterium sp. TaxID=2951999 RepID=UPI002D29E83E|nr:hypothetical protein [Alloacidobacterium sp.]HYK38367.1 hypothetical protein [Alloacidobacterium sp.]